MMKIKLDSVMRTLRIRYRKKCVVRPYILPKE